MNIEQIRQWVERAKAARTGGEAYPSDLRRVVATYALKQRDAGRTWADIQAEVGVSCTSIRIWMLSDQGGFHQIEVVDHRTEAAGEAELVLTSPNGFVVSGGSVEQLARLLVAVG